MLKKQRYNNVQITSSTLTPFNLKARYLLVILSLLYLVWVIRQTTDANQARAMLPQTHRLSVSNIANTPDQAITEGQSLFAQRDDILGPRGSELEQISPAKTAYYISISLDSLIVFHQTQMREQGWRVAAETIAEDQVALTYTKAEITATIVLNQLSDGRSRGLITLSHKFTDL